METFDELYYREPFTKEFDATVVACAPAGDGYEIELDDTAFYPLGGGQPGDRGTLAPAVPDGAAPAAAPEPAAATAQASDAEMDGPADPSIHVRDTIRRDDRVLHLTDAPLEPGTCVHGVLDWTWRRDNMEAHTGEHIVSGIVHKLYGYENIGFHMGDRCIEVDFSGVLTEEQALDVERRANAAVRADVPVNILLPKPDELAAMDYRSKKELKGPVRIVEIEGVDECACCGTHVATTGQVGLIKILRVSTKKKKTRIELLCGRRALLECEAEMAQLHEVSNFLSVGDEEAFEALERLSHERDDLKHELKQARRQAIDQDVAALAESDAALVRYEPAFDMDEQRYFCEQAVAEGKAGICAVIAPAPDSGKEQDDGPARLNYVIASTGADLRGACKELNARLNGRGGGKPQMVQGSFAATREDAEAALAEIIG